jgi:predicted O-methyltransferase YrrM
MYPNWFNMSHARENFERYAPRRRKLSCLQVGAYTGDATKWMVDNILTKEGSVLFDVDTWEGSEEPVHKNMDWSDVYTTYTEKNKEAIDSGKVFPRIMTSDKFFATRPDEEFDFIYIDGDHTAFGVVRDITNAYRVLKVGGILALDDYTWTLNQGDFYDPKPAIDWFINVSGDRLEKIILNGQAWFKKVK